MKPHGLKPITLENPVVHERHEITRTGSSVCNDYQHHLMGELPSLSTQLIYFVTFVFFVDKKSFKDYPFLIHARLERK